MTTAGNEESTGLVTATTATTDEAKNGAAASNNKKPRGGKRRSAGRPTKLTPEIQAEIVGYIADGNYREVAAQAAGLPRTTLYRWLSEGKKQAKGIYKEFMDAILKAEQDAEINAVKRIMEAGARDPDHLKWWLERKCPDRWGRERDRQRIRDLELSLKEVEKRLAELLPATPAIIASTQQQQQPSLSVVAH